ncbi:MAG: ROK family protein [Firmicutes bacterium]|nr:ROK family protein [Bacillota bacterium]
MKLLGIDIGGTNTKIGIVEDGKILKKTALKTNMIQGYDNFLDRLTKEVDTLTKGIDYAGVGVGCPGIIDTKNGVVAYANNLYFKNVPLASDISKRLHGKKVSISNDANTQALGEVKYGAGKGFSDVIMITLGTGVGAGIVVDGKLFEGYKGMGCEGGHTVIVVDGEPCSCGRNGCFEAYSSASALKRDTLKEMINDRQSLLWDIVKNDLNEVDGGTIFRGMEKGDKTSEKLFRNYVKYLSEGITNFVNVFRPQAVILGGGMAKEGDTLTNAVQEQVDEKRYGGKDSLPCKIFTPILGNDAAIIGAAELNN